MLKKLDIYFTFTKPDAIVDFKSKIASPDSGKKRGIFLYKSSFILPGRDNFDLVKNIRSFFSAILPLRKK